LPNARSRASSGCDIYLDLEATVEEYETAYHLGDNKDADSEPWRRTASFFWAGNPSSPHHVTSATEGVIAFAKFIKASAAEAKAGWRIKYYHDSDSDFFTNGEARAIFDQNDVSDVIDFVSHNYGDLLRGTDLGELLGAKLASTVERYKTAPGTLAAVKDVSALAALYKSGGFFFDTNAAPSESLLAEGSDFATRLNDAARDVGWPVYPQNGQKVTHQRVTIGHRVLEYTEPVLEVNAFFMPPAHFRVKEMLKSLLNYMNADPPIECLKRPARIARIGSDTVGSVTKQITWNMPREDHLNQRLAIWRTDRQFLGEQRGLTIEALGILKVYSNSWRSAMSDHEVLPEHCSGDSSVDASREGSGGSGAGLLRK
jgi:hypothetical protein